MLELLLALNFVMNKFMMNIWNSLLLIDKEKLLKRDTLASSLFMDINKFNDSTVDGRIYGGDGLGIAAAVDMSIVTKSASAYGEVVTEGAKTAGAIFYNMYTDFINDHSDKKNIFQMNDIDHDKYINMLAISLGLGDHKVDEI